MIWQGCRGFKNKLSRPCIGEKEGVCYAYWKVLFSDTIYIMNWMDGQTTIDISGTLFPMFTDSKGRNGERFWFIKDQFLKH